MPARAPAAPPDGSVTDAKVSATAGIQLSKLAKLGDTGSYVSITESSTSIVRIGDTPNLATGRTGIEFSSDGAGFVGFEHEPNFHLNAYGSFFHIRSSTSAFNVCAGDSTTGATATRLSVDTVNARVYLNSEIWHQGSMIGLNNVTPVARSTGWSVSNLTTDKSFDANATTIDELADVVGTLITYLISRGDLGA